MGMVEGPKCPKCQKLPLHPLRRYIFSLFCPEAICLQLLMAINQLSKWRLFEPLHAATTRYTQANGK
jgi:hypothetical protein